MSSVAEYLRELSMRADSMPTPNKELLKQEQDRDEAREQVEDVYDECLDAFIESMDIVKVERIEESLKAALLLAYKLMKAFAEDRDATRMDIVNDALDAVLDEFWRKGAAHTESSEQEDSGALRAVLITASNLWGWGTV